MKYLFALLALASTVAASEVRLAWNPSPTAGVTNYMLLAHTNAAAVTNYSLASCRVNVGTNLSCLVTDLQPGVWYFFVAAIKDGVVSEPSNVLILEQAQPASNMRAVPISYGTILNGLTNVTTIFFKLGVP